jgi:hypothetical protein
MATLISTSASNAGSTIADVLNNWVGGFGGSAHGAANTGGFNGGPFSGTQYSTSSKAGDSAFIAQSDTGLSYDISKHVVTGDLDSLMFGAKLDKTGTDFTLEKTDLSFTDLNWNSTTTNAALTDLQTVNTSNPAPVLEQISDLLAGLESSFADAVSHYNNLYDNDPIYTFDTITLEQLAAVDAAELTPIASALFTESELAMAA